MTVVRGFVITIASGIVFGLLGGVFGYLLGKFVPDFYRIVFGVPSHIQFDPTQIGLGLGVTQGFAAGLIIGLIIVLVVAWYRSKTTQLNRQ